MFPVVDDLRSIEFGTPGKSRENLVNFIINGNKRATAGLAADYEKEGEEVEFVGECLSMVNTDGEHVATLQVTRVDITRFADVPEKFALAEAEGDLNAADFRASHMEYWTKAGETITDDTMINQIYFTLLTHRLRNLEASDAEWITRACQDEEVQRWTKVPTHCCSSLLGQPRARFFRGLVSAQISQSIPTLFGTTCFSPTWFLVQSWSVGHF